MSTMKQAWEVESWEELKKLVSLDAVKAALYAREKNRLYHKAANLKKSAILAKAREIGLDKEV